MSSQPTHDDRVDQPDDDEPDEWDKRIIKTGCHDENLKLQLCHADTGDWRQCTKEMEAFRKCWSDHNNNQRVRTVDNDID
ncbi:cytochrome oxidase assembly factor 4 [[Candida] jaroonii]|uniref:Cytochrome oxidase assembly factor 4 n=1 Tax=[Candida] jaroonii TaxID=467808 RepID=A0ACA9Y3C5_9ASCO|nr:cytochrome oxidase assembly factor 4 [[Candida] jaroonii]